MSIYRNLSEALGIEYHPTKETGYSTLPDEYLWSNHKGPLNPFYGKKHTEESKQLMRESKLGKPSWNKGIPFGDETRKKMSLAKQGYTPWNKNKTGLQIAWNKGQKGTCKHTEEHKKSLSEKMRGVPKTDECKRKIRESLSGRKYETVKCPKCGFEGRGGAMKRYHFDNCKKGL